jgi:hypothetical protein
MNPALATEGWFSDFRDSMDKSFRSLFSRAISGPKMNLGFRRKARRGATSVAP